MGEGKKAVQLGPGGLNSLKASGIVHSDRRVAGEGEIAAPQHERSLAFPNSPSPTGWGRVETGSLDDLVGAG